jgi:hypothetical protein
VTRFEDGPAQNTALSLRRAPYYLRVVMKDGKFDALDQLEDTPAADEQITVYFLKSNDGFVHVDGRDPKTGKRFGRTETMATYKLCPVQPDDATVRSTMLWQAWCQEQGKR